MADFTGIISEIKMDKIAGKKIVKYESMLKMLNPTTINKLEVKLLIETMKPDLLQNNEAQCYTAARVLWDCITTSLFEGTQIHRYFELFLSKFEMGETDKILYNISVIVYILESEQKEDVMLDLIGLKTSKSELIKALKINYKNVPLEMCFKFVHFRLLPQIFSKFIDTKDKNEILDFIMSLPMGFACEFMSTEEKAQLKEDIMKVYLPAIRPDNNIAKWWNFCKVLIHYSGKLLHTEIELTNAILRRVECGFKAKIIESRAGSYECWKVLIENYNLDPKFLRSSKQISLLIKALKAKLSKNSIVSIKRFEAFTCFIEYLENCSFPSLQEFLSFCFGPFDEDYKKPSDITNNQYFPGRLTQEIYPYTAEILLKLIGHDKRKCSCNSESTYLTDVYKIKPFLDADNVNEHYEVFVNSVRICSLLLVEWTQGNNRNILIQCLWDTLFSTIRNCSDVSVTVLQNVVSNIRSIINTCLHYDSYYDILNGILKSVVKYIKGIDYKDEICKDFIYPLAYELCICEVKKPNSVNCNVTSLFNYCKEGIDFYKTIKGLFIDKIPKCDFTMKLLKCTVMNISNSDLKADLETKDIINELLMWFLDNDSKECYKVWKTAADGQIISIFPEIKYNLLKAIKEKAMKNSNVLQLVEVFVNLISKADKIFLNDIIITIRYSLRSVSKKAISNHISMLKPLIDIKIKHKFDNNRDFCILFVDLLKLEVYSVLSIVKYYVLNLNASERNELSKILHGTMNSITNNSDKKVSSEVSEILKLLDVNEPSIISRGAKIRNMAKVMPCGSPRSNLMQLFNDTPEPIFGSMLNKSPKTASPKFSMLTSSSISSRNKIDLNELSDADFVRIDADVFIELDKMSEHQKEVASKRRDDIPALYEDLTQSSRDILETQSKVVDSIIDKSKESVVENNFTNESFKGRTRRTQVENGSDDKNDANSSTDSTKRKRKRCVDDPMEIRNKSIDSIDNDVENKNGYEDSENVNEKSVNDSGEPKNKKRRSDLKSNDSAQTQKRKHVESEEMNNSRPEVTTPISSRTKRMVDNPTNAFKFKDNSPNTSSPITLMFKVPLNRSSLSKELFSPLTKSGVNNVSSDVSEDKTEEDTCTEKEKVNIKKEKRLMRFSTNKTHESLDNISDEKEEIESKNNKEKKADSPIKKGATEKESAINKNEDNSKIEEDSNKSAESTINDDFGASSAENSSANSLDISGSPSEMNTTEVTNSDRGRRGRGRPRLTRPVNRALNLLKMNIVGGEEFQNLPKMRNSVTTPVATRIRKRRSDFNVPRKNRVSKSPTESTSIEQDLTAKSTKEHKSEDVNENENKVKLNCSDAKKKSVEMQLKIDEKIATDAEKSKRKFGKNTKLDEDIVDVKKKCLSKSEKEPISNENETDRKSRSVKRFENKDSDIIENKNLDELEEIIGCKFDLRKRVSKQEKEPVLDETKIDAKTKPANKFEKEPKSKEGDIEKEKFDHKLEKQTETQISQESNLNDKPVKADDFDTKSVKDENVLDDKKQSISKVSKLKENIIDSSKEVDAKIKTRFKAGLKTKDDCDYLDIKVEQSKSKTSLIKNEKEENSKSELSESPVDSGEKNNAKENLIPKLEVQIKSEDTSASKKRKSTTKTGKRSSPKTVLEDIPDKNKPVTDSAISAVDEDVNSSWNISKISEHEENSGASPNIIESSSDDDNLRYPSLSSIDAKRKNQISPVPKIHEVRVALFRNNFDELSPEKINKISNLNEISPLKDTETLEIVGLDNATMKVCEMDTETMNVTSDLSDVSLNLAIEYTPEKSVSSDTLVSSPISHDTPTRNDELMKSTVDISPIKVDNDKKSGSKISSDIFTPQNEESARDIDILFIKTEDVPETKTSKSEAEIIALLKGPSSRSAKLLNLIPQALPIKTHKVILDSVPRAPQVSSPSTERIKRMMLNCEEQNQPELVPNFIDEDALRYVGKDILKFEKEVPSPLATPKVSILKRKLAETIEDGLSPCAKRKRVNFSDPPTTSEKIYFKEIEEKSNFKKMKKKSLKKLQYKIHQHTNNEQETDKNSEELFNDIKPLEEGAENDGGRVFRFVGPADLEDDEIVIPQHGPSKDIHILSNLIIKESPSKAKEKKTATIKNHNEEMLKIARNIISMVKETTPEEEFTELITNIFMETLSMEQLLKLVKDRTQEYSELTTGIVKETLSNKSTTFAVQLLEDVETVATDDNQVTVNLAD